LLSALLATLASTLTALTALLLAGPFVGIVHGYSLCCPQPITSPLGTGSCAAWGSSRARDFSDPYEAPFDLSKDCRLSSSGQTRRK
jgi:hypothetical protein